MKPFQTYQAYLSLKRHFNDSEYDCFKYNFKTNASVAAFEKRSDRFQFERLSRHDDPINFMVSNFIMEEPSWVGALLTDKAETHYSDWQKRMQSLTYVFTQDIERLKEPFDSNFIVKDGQHPHLYKLWMWSDVSPETVLILNDFLNFLPYWKRRVADQTVFPHNYLKLVKYRKFCKWDSNKYKNILRSRVLDV